MVFSHAPFSSYLFLLLSCFRPLAPERQCGENVEIFKELHHHQGTVDRRCVRRPLLASPHLSKPVIVSVLSSVRTSSSLTPPTSFECFACWLNTNQVGWKTSRLSLCTIVQRGNTQIPSLSDIRQYRFGRSILLFAKGQNKTNAHYNSCPKTQANNMEQGKKGAQSLFVLVTPSSPLPPSGGGKKILRIATSNFPPDAASGDATLSAGLPPQPWTTARGACWRPAGPWEPSPPSFTTLRPT